ncbi:MAG: Flp pilus assembly protein CpaB [Rhodomicrobium sp.]
MRFGPIVIFAAAALCAGAAALLVYSALLAPRGDTAPVYAVPASKPTKSVLVAARDLKAGEKLAAGSVREADWPADLLPKGAYTSRTALFSGGEEPTLSAAITENEPIVAQRLLNGFDSGLAGHLNNGMRALTIRVNEASGVGGFAQPEDRVDVLMTQTERLAEVSGGLPHAYTKTLVKNVRILAADQQTQRRQQTQPPKTVTLEVSEEDAKKLTLGGTIAQLSLTLSKGESSQVKDRPIDSREIAALDEQIHEPVNAGLDLPMISVFRSVERKEYRVPQE